MPVDATRRAIILFGTDEVVTPPRHLRAGAMSAELDGGNLRYIRWGGFEVLRAIAFVVRDTGWGTYAPVLSDLAIVEDAARFGVRYSADVNGRDGALRYTAEITGTADGVLTFHAEGTTESGFATNRTGFVVLHPLRGVVGRVVDVEHASGGRSTARFPERVDPSQPAMDIRALSHEAASGLNVTVRMEGDTFEMEDHRNWTDASFKTYVRPLARGFPYRIEAGEELDQRVALTVQGSPPKVAAPAGDRVIRLREPAGIMPEIGLSALDSNLGGILRVADRLAALGPSYFVARIDGRGDLSDVDHIAALARTIGKPLGLDIVIAGVDPAEELLPVVKAITQRGLTVDAVLVTPARDLRGRPTNDVPAGEADAAEILAAARAAFPGVRVGGGTVIGFPEFNRNRPPPGIDFLTHATHAIVHAADDISVMETLEALPDVIRSARAIAGAVPYRLGLATIGTPAETYFSQPAENPEQRRMTQTGDDPRQRGLFAAAFAVGYVATAAEAGVDAITLAACAGPAGILAHDGRVTPLAEIFRQLAAVAGRSRIGVAVPEGVAAIASDGDKGRVLWIANLSAMPVEVDIDDRRFGTIWCMDADALLEHAPDAIATRTFDMQTIRLDAYAVCRLS